MFMIFRRLLPVALVCVCGALTASALSVKEIIRDSDARRERRAQKCEVKYIAAEEACNEFESVIKNRGKHGFSDKDVIALHRKCLDLSLKLHLDAERFIRHYDAIMKLSPGYKGDEIFRWRYRPHYDALKEMSKFPLEEKDIKFGQTLASMGVKEKKTVHLKDFWNEKDVTEAFQKLIDDPEVTTIVLDRMPTPWYIKSVVFNHKVTGKRVLVKSGAKVLRVPEFRKCNIPKGGKSPGAMFIFKSCQNVIVESDAEKPEDVHVGFYESRAERLRYNKREGSSGFHVTHDMYRRPTRNIVIRNIRVADCECDGISISTPFVPPEEIFVENVILDSNFRQGTSLCSYYSVYFKNVTFSNTYGGSPGAGVDIEPWDSYLMTGFVYFFDCVFSKNAGGALYHATTTSNPVMTYIKRCRFKPTVGSQIAFISMPIGYFTGGRAPYSDIRVEDCVFESDRRTFSFSPAPVYNTSFKNCEIRDVRKRTGSSGGPDVINIELSRDLGKSDYPELARPEIKFENVRVKGFKDGEFLRVVDQLGVLNIPNIFSGFVNWNGKKLDASKFSYKAPGAGAPKTEYVDLKLLKKPKSAPDRDIVIEKPPIKLTTSGFWWHKSPVQSCYFWAEKGRGISFELSLGYNSSLKVPAKEKLFIVAPSGRKTDVADATTGKHDITFTASETGWHRFTPAPEAVVKSLFSCAYSYSVKNIRGTRFAWQADTLSDSFAKFTMRDPEEEYTGYFEVPPGGKECRIKISSGSMAIKDPKGRIVDSVRTKDYKGHYIFRIRPLSKRAEIWSFTTSGRSQRALRFYAPLNGIWADTPESLPRLYER
jgi:hypothetical protein